MTPKSHSTHILIVDDEADIRGFLVRLLTAEGVEFLEAESGEEGLGLIRQGIPNLVLLDINLPGMDGMHVLKEAKKIDAATPIIMMTGNGTIQSAVEAVKPALRLRAQAVPDRRAGTDHLPHPGEPAAAAGKQVPAGPGRGQAVAP